MWRLVAACELGSLLITVGSTTLKSDVQSEKAHESAFKLLSLTSWSLDEQRRICGCLGVLDACWTWTAGDVSFFGISQILEENHALISPASALSSTYPRADS